MTTSQEVIAWVNREREFAIKNLQYRAERKGLPQHFIDKQGKYWDMVVEAMIEYAEKYLNDDPIPENENYLNAETMGDGE